MVFSILFLIIMCDRFLRDLTEQKGPCRGRRKPAEAADDASADSSDNSSVEEDTDDEVLCDEDMHTLAEVESNSSSSSESDKETECTVPEPHYDAFDRHKKCVRRWKFEANGITETNYSRANTSSRWRNVPLNEWGKLSACDMYKMQRPAGEMECWKQFSDQNLKRKGYKESTLNEWEHFQGVLLAAAQGGFKGGSPQVSSRVPSRNAYCIANQCFAKHAAECNTNSLEKNSASHCRVCTIDDVLRLPCVLNLPVETRSMAIASRRRRNAENERLNALPHGNREAHGTQRPTGFGPGRGNGSGRGNGRGLQRGHVRGGMHGRGCYSASQDRGDRVEENGSGEGKEEDFDDSSTIQTSQSLRRGRPHGGTGHRRSSNLSRTSTVSISMIQKHPV